MLANENDAKASIQENMVLKLEQSVVHKKKSIELMQKGLENVVIDVEDIVDMQIILDNEADAQGENVTGDHNPIGNGQIENGIPANNFVDAFGNDGEGAVGGVGAIGCFIADNIGDNNNPIGNGQIGDNIPAIDFVDGGAVDIEEAPGGVGAIGGFIADYTGDNNNPNENGIPGNNFADAVDAVDGNGVGAVEVEDAVGDIGAIGEVDAFSGAMKFETGVSETFDCYFVRMPAIIN